MKIILAGTLMLIGCFSTPKPIKVKISETQLSKWEKVCKDNGGLESVEFKPVRKVHCKKVTFLW
jgi:starvation-inducible outer membrane lipoprotein